MSKPLKKPDALPASGIDTGTFWEVIEKLLLHSSSNERTRVWHNLSLSALCKSQALPPLPRPKRSEVKRTYRKLKQIEKDTNKVVVPNSVKRSAKIATTLNSSLLTLDKDNENELIDDVLEIRNEIQNADQQKIEASKEDVLKRYSPDSKPPFTTKSECCLNDLRIHLVKDANAPVSERLWRFAMRNKKRTEGNNAMRASPISKARSNEAIYRGLQERLNEFERGASKREEIIIDTAEGTTKDPEVAPKKIKENRSRAKLPNVKHTYPKRHSCPNRTHHDEKHIQYRQTPSMLSLRCQNTNPTYAPRSSRFKSPHSPFSQQEVPEITSFPLLKRQDFDERRALYDSVLKKRLRCGCKLESLNKEIVSKGNSRSILNGETTKMYNELKSEYLKLCHEESQLKHHIALLNAEIYMMQNKGYHKKPATVKTITLDSKIPLHPESNVCFKDCYPLPPVDAPFFPPLKAPRPLLQPRASQEKLAERFEPKKQRLVQDKEEKLSSLPEILTGKVNSLPEIDSQLSFSDLGDDKVGHASVCSVYSLDAAINPPPKHEPELAKGNKVKQEDSLIKLIHRLPKLKHDRALCNLNKC